MLILVELKYYFSVEETAAQGNMKIMVVNTSYLTHLVSSQGSRNTSFYVFLPEEKGVFLTTCSQKLNSFPNCSEITWKWLEKTAYPNCGGVFVSFHCSPVHISIHA